MAPRWRDFFRCWPDGSGLEIVHRSFTNSWGFDWDDYGNWIGQDNEGPRLIHFVDGGDYGLDIGDRRAGQPGVLPGIPTDNARNHGYVIQSGLVVYSGDAFPSEYRGDVFEGAPGLHKILRDTLEPMGASFYASEQEDFVVTDDPWHRPIALTVGPDGAIYMLDWYNEILAHVEHPLDSVRRDKTRGRIYRIAWKGAPVEPYPDLTKATAEELRDNLRSDNRWLRRMSQRLLAAKGEEIVDLVLPLLHRSEAPRTRCHALWTLTEARLGTPSPSSARARKAVVSAFDDSDSRVRAAALRSARIIEISGEDYAKRLVELTRDDDDFVKFEAATSLAHLAEPLPMREISAIIARAQWEDPFLSIAFTRAIEPQREEVVMTAFEIGARGLARDKEGLLPALLQLRDERTVPLLIALMRQRNLSEAAAEELVSGLYGFGSPEIFGAMVKFLAERPTLPPKLARPILADLRMRKAKGELAQDEIERVLMNLSDRGERDLQRDVLLTAAKLGTRALESRIANELRSADAATAEAAILAAGELGIQELESELLAIAKGEDSRRRWAAVRALARVGESPEATEVFLGALASPDSASDAIAGLIRNECRAEVLAKVVTEVAAGRVLIQENSRRQIEAWIREGAGEQREKYSAQITAADGVLRDWKIIGPFPNPDTKGHATVYPPETELDEKAEYTYFEQTIGWRDVRSDHADGLVDLLGMKPSESAVAYGWTTYHSDEARSAILYCGSDDSIKVWVNGELVHDHLVDRGLVVDQDQAIVNLRKGENTILVKCGQNRGGWNFHARIACVYAANSEGGSDKSIALYLKGNAARGREVFFQGAVGCAKCHAVGDEGGRVGPDLTEVGWLNPRSYILNSILNPSDDIAEGFAGVRIETKGGDVYDGYINRESRGKIEFVTSEGRKIEIAPRDIARRESRAISGMPDGLDESMTTQELADLLAFLENSR